MQLVLWTFSLLPDFAVASAWPAVVWLKADLTISLRGLKSLGPLLHLVPTSLECAAPASAHPGPSLHSWAWVLSSSLGTCLLLFIFLTSLLIKHLSQEQRREDYAWIHLPHLGLEVQPRSSADKSARSKVLLHFEPKPASSKLLVSLISTLWSHLEKVHSSSV